MSVDHVGRRRGQGGEERRGQETQADQRIDTGDDLSEQLQREYDTAVGLLQDHLSNRRRPPARLRLSR